MKSKHLAIAEIFPSNIFLYPFMTFKSLNACNIPRKGYGRSATAYFFVPFYLMFFFFIPPPSNILLNYSSTNALSIQYPVFIWNIITGFSIYQKKINDLTWPANRSKSSVLVSIWASSIFCCLMKAATCGLKILSWFVGSRYIIDRKRYENKTYLKCRKDKEMESKEWHCIIHNFLLIHDSYVYCTSLVVEKFGKSSKINKRQRDKRFETYL